MTVREELIREIEHAPDTVLKALLTLLQLTKINQPTSSVWQDSLGVNGSTSQQHYPLRGLPLVIAEDFDAPMTDLWDALES
jgi:hypothetical protein